MLLTEQTLKILSFGIDTRPDTTRVKILARPSVGERFARVGEVNTAIAAFVKTVPVSGRSYIESAGTDLAINNPQAYRGAVVKAIADEAKRYAAMFGNDYGVETCGLDSELFFKQASETEVFSTSRKPLSPGRRDADALLQIIRTKSMSVCVPLVRTISEVSCPDNALRPPLPATPSPLWRCRRV